MAIKKASNFLIINGIKFPPPMPGMDIISTQAVSSGRNTNGAFVGDLVGRRMWKINNLQWGGLDAETWSSMKAAIEPFTVPVTFTGDDNVRRTLYMYPGDTNAKPLFLDDIFYKNFETCKFNLIDCGW